MGAVALSAPTPLPTYTNTPFRKDGKPGRATEHRRQGLVRVRERERKLLWQCDVISRSLPCLVSNRMNLTRAPVACARLCGARVSQSGKWLPVSSAGCSAIRCSVLSLMSEGYATPLLSVWAVMLNLSTEQRLPLAARHSSAQLRYPLVVARQKPGGLMIFLQRPTSPTRQIFLSSVFLSYDMCNG